MISSWRRSSIPCDQTEAPAIPSWQSNPSFADSRGARVFLASFLVLFLEVALIRLMPAYIRLLAYFSNFILRRICSPRVAEWEMQKLDARDGVIRKFLIYHGSETDFLRAR